MHMNSKEPQQPTVPWKQWHDEFVLEIVLLSGVGLSQGEKEIALKLAKSLYANGLSVSASSQQAIEAAKTAPIGAKFAEQIQSDLSFAEAQRKWPKIFGSET